MSASVQARPEMIGQLRGTLAEKHPDHVVIDVAGVGYLVHIPISTFTALGAAHEPVTLLVHTHLREDQIALYGFLTAREKQLFQLLISASGVGPTLALKVLSGLSLDELVPAIQKGDIAQLVRIPGIGRKTAERMVVELRDKISAVESHVTAAPRSASQLEADVASALINLGYDRRGVESAVAQGAKNGAKDFETLLRAALQALSGAKSSRPARAGE